ncbi:MAG: hypothetical protein GDA51_09985 [Ekhidna sp.]|nr:hypothetical protein [Ekhidna sp.]
MRKSTNNNPVTLNNNPVTLKDNPVMLKNNPVTLNNNPGTCCKNPPKNLRPSAPLAGEEYKEESTSRTGKSSNPQGLSKQLPFGKFPPFQKLLSRMLISLSKKNTSIKIIKMVYLHIAKITTYKCTTALNYYEYHRNIKSA